MVIVPFIISAITKKICYNYTQAELVEVKSTLTNKILDKLLFEKIKRKPNHRSSHIKSKKQMYYIYNKG